MPCLCWEQLFSMLCMNKGSSLNLEIMLSGNYGKIIIMLMFIYVYTCVYVCCCLTGP